MTEALTPPTPDAPAAGCGVRDALLAPYPDGDLAGLAMLHAHQQQLDRLDQDGRPPDDQDGQVNDLRIALANGWGHGSWISPGELRRRLCDCSFVPQVLGSNSQPLDIGRASRNIPTHIRRAIETRDNGCAFPGCDRTMKRCEIHHIIEWTNRGTTDVNNLVMLCIHHHQLVHNSTWRAQIVDGQPEFIPPEWAG
ncbi:MAG TPA: HNH endonuclease signature motif containing protein [Pseudonocardia sp.]